MAEQPTMKALYKANEHPDGMNRKARREFEREMRRMKRAKAAGEAPKGTEEEGEATA